MTIDLKSLYDSPDAGQIMPYPSLDGVGRYLDAIAREHPRLVDLQVAGTSVEGRAIWRVVLTDQSHPDDNKLVVVAVAQEHGEERSGSIALLELIDELLVPTARVALRSHIIVLLPFVNPDAWESRSFGNCNGVNLFTDYYLTESCSQPESEAVRASLDRYRPEVLANLHGRSTGSDIRAVEGSGLAYASSQYERGHASLFIEDIACAAEAAGYPQDRGEEDAERLLAWIPGGEHRCFGSQFGVTTGVYAYHHYHTLSVCMEAQEPASGGVRMRRILQLGTECWRTEGVPGYPVNVMAWNCHAFLCAAGRTAAQLRDSRQRLWQLQGRCAFAYGVPARVGQDVIAFSPDFADRARWGGKPLSDVLDSLTGDVGVDVPAMRAFWDRPEATTFLLTEERGKPELSPATTTPLLDVPVGLRLRLPGGSRVTRVLLNGHEIDPDAGQQAGYSSWDTPNGFTMVQAQVDPGGSASGRLVMMVAYEPLAP